MSEIKSVSIYHSFFPHDYGKLISRRLLLLYFKLTQNFIFVPFLLCYRKIPLLSANHLNPIQIEKCGSNKKLNTRIDEINYRKNSTKIFIRHDATFFGILPSNDLYHFSIQIL